MKTRLVKALIMNAEGNIAKHKLNIEVFLNNPSGVADHSDYIQTIQDEIDRLSHFEDQLETINKHFG